MLSLYVTFFNILKKISFQKNVVSSNQGHNLGLNIQYSIIFIKYKIAEKSTLTDQLSGVIQSNYIEIILYVFISIFNYIYF